MVIVPCDSLRRLRRRQPWRGLQCSPQRAPITPQNSLAPHQLTMTMNSRNERGSEKGNHVSDSASFRPPCRSSRRRNTSSPVLPLKVHVSSHDRNSSVGHGNRPQDEARLTALTYKMRGVPGLFLKGCVGTEHAAGVMLRGFNYVMADIHTFAERPVNITRIDLDFRRLP